MRDPKLLLDDVARSLAEIEQAIAGHSIESYEQTFNLAESVNWRLAVAGEAANLLLRAQPELEDLFPELKRLIAVRHRIVHGYFSVDNDQVWAIVTSYTPGLANRLRRFMDDLP
jgi:uncharacterized protein with HEPN domain